MITDDEIKIRLFGKLGKYKEVCEILISQRVTNQIDDYEFIMKASGYYRMQDFMLNVQLNKLIDERMPLFDRS